MLRLLDARFSHKHENILESNSYRRADDIFFRNNFAGNILSFSISTSFAGNSAVKSDVCCGNKLYNGSDSILEHAIK